MPSLTGLYLRYGDSIDPSVNERVHASARALLQAPPAGVSDVVPSYSSVYIEYDPAALSERALRAWLLRLPAEAPQEGGRTVTVPVRYDGDDLGEIARHAGLSPAEVIRRHSDRPYRVYALGFTPGFTFMGEVDPAIRKPRRPAPRARVPAHTVALAGAQTGIYPLASPGGWNLLGTALTAVYDPHRAEPFLLGPGDTVRFLPTGGDTPPDAKPLELLPEAPERPLLRVLERGLLDLVMDGGRFLAGRFGLARSGPLDPSSARLANRLLGNAPDAPLLEINVSGPALEALGGAVLAFAGWGVAPQLNGEAVAPFTSFAVRRDDVLRFVPQRDGVRGYLAVAGGLDSGTFLGSSSTDVRGLIGRPLEPGDVLGTRARSSARAGFGFRPYRPFGRLVTLRLLPGPQADEAAWSALLRERFTVARADRMGLQLDGPEVPGGDVLSEATPLGAVQVTAGGRPLVLLNDRGTLGGYAKPAVLHPADLPRAAQLRSGDAVRFVRAPDRVPGPAEARV